MLKAFYVLSAFLFVKKLHFNVHIFKSGKKSSKKLDGEFCFWRLSGYDRL